jgi:hypothetical protein
MSWSYYNKSTDKAALLADVEEKLGASEATYRNIATGCRETDPTYSAVASREADDVAYATRCIVETVEAIKLDVHWNTYNVEAYGSRSIGSVSVHAVVGLVHT